MDEYLLGFILRVLDPAIRQQWTEERVRNFLCKEEFAVPLSVDSMVWPDVQVDDAESAGDWSREIAWVSLNDPLWTDLPALRAHCIDMEQEYNQPYAIVAISRFLQDKAEVLDSSNWPHTLDVSPSLPESTWTTLGFDVADTDLISGLLNCGVLESEREQRIAKFGSHLNQFHLFDELAPAIACKHYEDQRVTEHAPFFVHRLWMVELRNGATSPATWANWKE